MIIVHQKTMDPLYFMVDFHGHQAFEEANGRLLAIRQEREALFGWWMVRLATGATLRFKRLV